MKRSLKRWLLVPINTADKTIYKIFDIPNYIKYHCIKIKDKMINYQDKPQNIKYYPPSILKLIRIMYSTKCN